MIQAMKMTGWALATTVALIALFKPEIGLIHAGPGAAMGVGLLGAAMCVHAHKQLAPKS